MKRVIKVLIPIFLVIALIIFFKLNIEKYYSRISIKEENENVKISITSNDDDKKLLVDTYIHFHLIEKGIDYKFDNERNFIIEQKEFYTKSDNKEIELINETKNFSSYPKIKFLFKYDYEEDNKKLKLYIKEDKYKIDLKKFLYKNNISFEENEAIILKGTENITKVFQEKLKSFIIIKRLNGIAYFIAYFLALYIAESLYIAEAFYTPIIGIILSILGTFGVLIVIISYIIF